MAGMEGRGPYRIYDPGGGSAENGSVTFERLVEENTRLKEKMQGIKSIGNSCVAGNELHLWGSSARAHRARGFLAVLRKGVVRSRVPWHQGSPCPGECLGFFIEGCRGKKAFPEFLGCFMVG